jgi:non-lysosomal glucosylceramidase
VAAVPMSDPAIVQIQANGSRAARKLPGAVPHDLGGPSEDPLLRVNYYRFQDINIWKDLNSKFVLQLWRDYVFTSDRALVHDSWPAVVQALDYLRAFDRDGDGLPDHDGLPDQTYDTWPMTGASAYGGSLWLAALKAAIEMGKLEGDDDSVARYSEWLATGQASFEAKLWNGRYYLYDASGGPRSDSIMADQLAGQWYADATGLSPIVPDDHVLSALRTIYDYNVRRFADGQMGAVNGMRPDGAVDTSSEQSQEVWAGTTYALAAFMLHRGLADEAWKTAWGVYDVTYNRGYWFRTPEAHDIHNNFRASMYMRPLSVWAVEHALRTMNR